MLVEPLHIASSLGDYTVTWGHSQDAGYQNLFRQCRAVIVDQKVWDIYGHDVETFGLMPHVIPQEAQETLKTLDTCISLCEQLLNLGFRRGEYLLAVGGGIIQDLVTLTASILFRGIPWIYIPTTLLAQADSCIGGKSSINHQDMQRSQLRPDPDCLLPPHQ